RVFSRMMHQAAQARSRLNADLKGAWERDEFFLNYQPVLKLDTLEVEAAEALLRWNHAERGLIHASQFVAALERSGDIVGLTTWIISRAAEEHAKWSATGCSIPKLSVNLPAQFLLKPELSLQLRRELEAANIELDCLVLEFSEAAYTSIHEIPKPIMEMREAGTACAIDNFGGGGIALTKISHLAIDIYKLDRSFLRSPLSSRRDRALLSGIAKIGRELNRQVVAKGIETRAQLQHLRKLGFHGGQGYVFSRPLNGPDIPVWSMDWGRQLTLDQDFRKTA
ncbi:MAG: EAL domain-containing protein, partial [Pseudomonadota bacterium]